MSHRLPLADIQFITEFAKFCRSKGDEEYDYEDATVCALAQFGHPNVQEHDWRGVPEPAFYAAVGIEDVECNFSALADRLEALIADAPRVL